MSHITTCGAKSVSTNQFTNMIKLLFKVAVLVAGLFNAHFSKVYQSFITVHFLIFEYDSQCNINVVIWPQMIPNHGHRSIWIKWPFSTLKLIRIELEVILLSWWWKFCHSHCLLSKLNQHLRTVIHLSTKLVLIIGVIYLTCMRKKTYFIVCLFDYFRT